MEMLIEGSAYPGLYLSKDYVYFEKHFFFFFRRPRGRVGFYRSVGKNEKVNNSDRAFNRENAALGQCLSVDNLQVNRHSKMLKYKV